MLFFFGRDYYETLSAAKIVLNGAIDISGPDRRNMHCFEGALEPIAILSDADNYPEGMNDGQTLVTYNSAEHAVTLVRHCWKCRKESEYRAPGP